MYGKHFSNRGSSLLSSVSAVDEEAAKGRQKLQAWRPYPPSPFMPRSLVRSLPSVRNNGFPIKHTLALRWDTSAVEK
eukprot:2286776-Rhodomonas_salina.2